jgi:hypothetical protein
VKILLASGPVVLAFGCTTAAAAPPGANYPWVQPPATPGTILQVTLPPQILAQIQPPAWIPILPVVHVPAIAGSSYRWVQLPAWVGTSAPASPLPTTAYPWVQPPAWISTG